MEFELLGGLNATREGIPLDLGGPKQRAVVAALLLEPGQPVSIDRLVDRIWSGAPPARAEASLQSYVSNLRRVLEPERRAREEPSVLVTRGAGYALAVERSDVDLARFQDLAARGHRELTAGDPSAAAATLDAALALWAGPPLPELATEGWVADAATGAERIRAQALEDRIDAALALGSHVDAVPLAEGAVALDPYRERFRAQLALALYRSGRQREGLATLAEARRTLIEDVGVEPGRELRDLEAAMLAQAPELDPPPRPARLAPPEPSGGTGTDDGRFFVGRERELTQLVDALAAARSGPGRPVVVSGEPGIGKTRLVEELAEVADGQLVLWARCPESGAQAAYWPLVQIARQLSDAGATGETLDALLLATTDTDPTSDPLARHVAVADALARLTTPVVVVIDDLQWADAGTLRLLEFVAGELRRTHLLVVATVRPVGPDTPSVVVDCLGELVRQPGALRVDLAGLAPAEVREWVDRRDGRVAEGIAELVHTRTGGNAFFVGEVVELLAAEGRLGDVERASQGSTVPAAVHDVVRRRVGRLPGPTQQLLSAASVVGRTFELDVLAAVAEQDPLSVLDALDPAIEAGLVEEHGRPGCLQFTHALVADALSEELSAARRARLHAATARALARLRGTASDEEMAAMAHHAFAGAAAGTATEAYEWSVRAAHAAASRGAHIDAAEHWRRAADAARVARPQELRPRFDALREAGEALLRVDVVGDGYVALVTAIELGLNAGDPEMVASAAAAMSLGGLWVAGEVGLVEVDAVGALRRAVDSLPATPTPQRVLALGALAENGYWTLATDEIDALAVEALDDARVVGDDAVLVRSLETRIKTAWRASGLAERQAAALELAEVLDTRELAPAVRAGALYGVASVRWDEGAADAAARLVDEGARLAERAGAPALITQLGFFRASIDYHRGEVGAALDRIVANQDLHRRTRGWGSEGIGSSYKTACWMEGGDVDSIVAAEEQVLTSPYGLFFQEFHGLAYTLSGELERADRILAQLPPLIDSWLFLGLAAAAAHNRVALGREAEARVLHEQLRPYSGRVATPGTGPVLGDVDLALARIDRMLGDPVAADAHLDASIATLTTVGSVPWVVRALLLRHEWHGDAADLQRAADLVEGTELVHLREVVRGRQVGSK